MSFGVYSITNSVNSKQYIGSSVDIKRSPFTEETKKRMSLAKLGKKRGPNKLKTSQGTIEKRRETMLSKATCKKGHTFSVRVDGSRWCRECKNVAWKARYTRLHNKI